MTHEIVQRDEARIVVRTGEPGELTAEDFARVATLLRAASGIHLGAGKESFVRARLAGRVRALGLPDYRAYIDLLARDPGGAEMELAIDLLSTGKTSFFREARHFEFLAELIKQEPRKKLRIWSAACSTGEEPYSIAMTLAHCGALLPYCNARVLATDICRHALTTARAGAYRKNALGDVPPELRARFLEDGPAVDGASVVATVKQLVAFARLNLMEPWPMRGPFDVIFCRNVMIYFDRETQTLLVERMRQLLAPGGFLIIGLAESLSPLQHEYTDHAPSVYRR
jgi:chemotaxis protein methyltransferase CheR